MSEYRIQDTTLTDIADAIRSKTGSAATILVSEMANEIESIPTGGGGGGGDEERNKTVQKDLGFIDLENDSRVTLPSGLVWTKSSTYKYGTEEGYNSPSIGHNSSTTQELTFTSTKDGVLTVFYTCTSEAGYDYLNIAVDGSTKQRNIPKEILRIILGVFYKLNALPIKQKHLLFPIRKTVVLLLVMIKLVF